MLKQCIGDDMLKKDKRYQDLAIKVATRMCKGHLHMHLKSSAPEALLTLSAIHLTLFPDTELNQLKKVLSDSFDGAMAEYHEMVAGDDDFMEVLVDELGLSVSDIDFDAVIKEFTKESEELINDVAESAMKADITRFSDDDDEMGFRLG